MGENTKEREKRLTLFQDIETLVLHNDTRAILGGTWGSINLLLIWLKFGDLLLGHDVVVPVVVNGHQLLSKLRLDYWMRSEKQEKGKDFRLNIHEEDTQRNWKKLEETGERKKEKFSQT